MNYEEIELDRNVRLAAFDFLTEQIEKSGEVLSFQVLMQGFFYQGERICLLGPQGIFKPRILPEIPLSMTTAPEIPGRSRPYDDRPAEQGIMIYRYRGVDPFHRDNVGLRLAMQTGTPLIYLYGVEKGAYRPIWPVFVIDDDPANLSFHVVVDDAQAIHKAGFWIPNKEGLLLRSYITVEVQQRLHQVAFRAHVLRAYQHSCSICRLRHPELLEAAHIYEDAHPLGIPAVSNGLALCAIHHRAFDQKILGITPDYAVVIREDILEETDGPMLQWGLQAFQNTRIHLPRRQEEWPNRAALEERFGRFKANTKAAE
jgi:putative restriction endonuclease